MRCPRSLDESEHEWRGNHTCSYCGSLSPDEFFRRVEAGDEVGPTDKSYKAYLKGASRSKMYFQHFSAEDQGRFIDLLNSKEMKIGVPGHFYTTPFFIKFKTVEDKLDDSRTKD
jgi:hypothetical protein